MQTLVIIALLALFSMFYYVSEGFRFTRNMSYDLRGDPCIIRPMHTPWNMSSTAGLSKLYNPHIPYCDELEV